MISDRKCIQLIPESLCTDDAGEYLKNICFASFIKNSGQGIFVELLSLLQDSIKNIRNSG